MQMFHSQLFDPKTRCHKIISWATISLSNRFGENPVVNAERLPNHFWADSIRKAIIKVPNWISTLDAKFFVCVCECALNWVLAQLMPKLMYMMRVHCVNIMPNFCGFAPRKWFCKSSNNARFTQLIQENRIIYLLISVLVNVLRNFLLQSMRVTP